MGHNRVASVHDTGVVSAFVEHTHIYAQVVGQIYGAAHRSLIGADYHQVILVNLQCLIMGEEGLDKLISRHKIIKSV